MCPLGVTAREPGIRAASAYLRQLALSRARIGPESGQKPDPEPGQNRIPNRTRIDPKPGQNRIPNRARTGPAGSILIHPDPPQIHPRSTSDPPQIHPRSRCRSRSECRSRFNTQLIAYFAIRVLLWGNFGFFFRRPPGRREIIKVGGAPAPPLHPPIGR